MRNPIQELEKWKLAKQSRWYKIEQDYDIGEGSTLGMELGEAERTLLAVATWFQEGVKQRGIKLDNFRTYWHISIWDKEGEPVGLERLILSAMDAWNEKYPDIIKEQESPK